MSKAAKSSSCRARWKQSGGTARASLLTLRFRAGTIELRGELTYGMTLCDARHLSPFDGRSNGPHRGKQPNAEVAVAVNADRFWEFFFDALAQYR